MARHGIRSFLALGLGLTCASCCALRCGRPVAASQLQTAEERLEKKIVRSGGRDWTIYHTKTGGPPILLMHELPGLSIETIELALKLADSPERYRVYLPLFFGRLGETSSLKHMAGLAAKAAGPRWDVCSSNSMGTVADEMHELCGCLAEMGGHTGRKIAVIGSCLTGNLAVSLLSHPSVSCSAACQPAIPFVPCSHRRKKSLAMPAERLAAVAKAAQAGSGKRLIGFRFLGDSKSPVEKFEALHASLGSHFEPWMLAPDSSELPAWARHVPASRDNGHSTLTAAKQEDQPARNQAIGLLLDFLRRHHH